MKKTVTAIVPAYNEAPRITKILKILSGCDCVDEIICVNDGSKDNTEKVVRSDFPFVRLINLKANQGKGFAMAEGVKAAKGEIVLFVDADLIGLCEQNIKDILNPLITGEADASISTRDYWVDNWFARALSGERAYFRKDLLPHLTDMSNLGYKVEIFLNHKFCDKKVKVVLIKGVVAPYKWDKLGSDDGLKRHFKMIEDILSHVMDQPSPIEFFYKSYIKNFYLPLDAKSISLKNYKDLTKAEIAQIPIGETHLKEKKIHSISVVIPAYNEESYIRNTLVSLQNQTVKPDEIIVVDNNSSDKTAKIAMEYGCKVIFEKKKGISLARNAGFDAASSDIIARTDADTIPDLHWIENIKKYTSLGIEALTGPVFFDTPLLKTNPKAIETFMLLLRFVFGHSIWFGANMVISKKLWQKAKHHMIFDDKRTHEDTELAIAVSKYASIQYKRDLIVCTSSRRMKKDPTSFFAEYQLRLWRMVARQQRGKMKTYYNKIKVFLEQDIFSEDW